MSTFADLPDALVRDLLAKANEVAAGVANTLGNLRQAKAAMRSACQGANLIRRKADLDVTREPSVVGEVEELPKPTDTIITVSNPRLRDGKDVHYLEHNVVKVIWPMEKLSLIEVLQSEEEENLIGFVRE